MVYKNNASNIDNMYRNGFANRQPRGNHQNDGMIKQNTKLPLLIVKRLAKDRKKGNLVR